MALLQETKTFQSLGSRAIFSTEWAAHDQSLYIIGVKALCSAVSAMLLAQYTMPRGKIVSWGVIGAGRSRRRNKPIYASRRAQHTPSNVRGKDVVFILGEVVVIGSFYMNWLVCWFIVIMARCVRSSENFIA
ncbi:hypothetical protein F5Y08DRAFT_239705 [Xylaria arbuscula]|nr:hypothetical protein F5Y08DRAFT_239705 [Xylaria arbuscula]